MNMMHRRIYTYIYIYVYLCLFRFLYAYNSIVHHTTSSGALSEEVGTPCARRGLEASRGRGPVGKGLKFKGFRVCPPEPMWQNASVLVPLFATHVLPKPSWTDAVLVNKMNP